MRSASERCDAHVVSARRLHRVLGENSPQAFLLEMDMTAQIGEKAAQHVACGLPRIGDTTVKELAVFVHSLGGGE